jgi:hypothetical protein
MRPRGGMAARLNSRSPIQANRRPRGGPIRPRLNGPGSCRRMDRLGTCPHRGERFRSSRAASRSRRFRYRDGMDAGVFAGKGFPFDGARNNSGWANLEPIDPAPRSARMCVGRLDRMDEHQDRRASRLDRLRSPSRPGIRTRAAQIHDKPAGWGAT